MHGYIFQSRIILADVPCWAYARSPFPRPDEPKPGQPQYLVFGEKSFLILILFLIYRFFPIGGIFNITKHILYLTRNNNDLVFEFQICGYFVFAIFLH